MRRLILGALALAILPAAWSEYPIMPNDADIAVPGSLETVPWTPLFDGRSLEGWRAEGGGRWSVANGCIVGERGDGRHGWLVTERPYADFFLEFEFKMVSPGNSGVQLRSHLFGEVMAGYQADILGPGDERTGGIYEEHGRGWLAQPDANHKMPIELGRWNTYRVTAIGDRLTTVVNGVTCVDIVDEPLQSRFGIIALQVHSGDEPIEMLWRNIRIQDYGYGRSWTHLFNGRDLSQWNIQGIEPWKVDRGTILGWNGKAGGNGYLASKKKYDNFVARLKYRMEGEGNSGLFFRSRFKEADVWGVQSEIDYRPEHNPTGLYESGGRNWIATPPLEKASVLFNSRGWNEIMVYANGNNIRTYLNGYKLIDFVDEAIQHTRGQLGLQVHSGKTCKIRFKDVAIMEMK